MKSHPITVYLPDTKDVRLSEFGSGNMKLGFGVYTFSRLPGRGTVHGTCPGSTTECEAICFAKRVDGVIRGIWLANSLSPWVPELPNDCKTLRIHVGGDFDTEEYIHNWIERLKQRPDVTAWAYTRSWRVPALLPALERLRALPNFQLFASMDPSCQDTPPAGWRRAWIHRDFDTAVKGPFPMEERLTCLDEFKGDNMVVVSDGVPAYVCPEETGRKANCISCGYCFVGKKHDVVFLEHSGDS